MALGLASANLLGITLLPIYFLYNWNVTYLSIYLGVVLMYAISFVRLICPLCATRHVCPGGQTSIKLRALINGSER